MTAKTRTCFWFDGQGEEAATFYVSLLPDSRIERILRPDPAGPAMVVDVTLAGTPYQILNGGPQYPQSESASIVVLTDDQPETDRLWKALTEPDGAEGKCGWLKDRYGLSWQIVPKKLPELLGSEDKAAAGRATQAFMTMSKIDMAALEAAAAAQGTA